MGMTKFQRNMSGLGKIQPFKQKYKNGEVLKLHKKWCDHPAEQQLYWVVLEFSDVTGRYKVGLVGAEYLGRAFGSTITVDGTMVYKPKGEITDKVIQQGIRRYKEMLNLR